MSDNKTYSIEFVIVHQNGSRTSKKCNMKNCMSEIHAKIKLSEHLKKTVADYKDLEVTSCRPNFAGFADMFGSGDNPFGDMFDIFGFGKK